MIVCRELERARIRELIGEARRGRAGRLVLRGEPGIGKTTLLGFAVACGDGMTVLRATGVESEAEVPFGGLLELLRPVADDVTSLPRPQAKALRAALALADGDAGDRFAVGAGTLAVLAAVAERAPLLIVVDDLQWVDRPSLDAVVFAARRLDADAVAVVVALRDDGAPTVRLFDEAEELVVGGLDHAGAEALVGGAVSSEVLAATGGNPLALLALDGSLDADATAMPITIPQRLARPFTRRIEALPTAARRALLVVAAEDTGSVVVIGAALARWELTLLDLGPAEDAGLLSVAADRVTFRHPLARSAAYQAATPTERRASHAALAGVVPTLIDPHRRAWHRAAAATGPDETVARALEDVGRAASGRGAYGTAAHAFERSAALTPPGQDAAPRLLDAAWAARHAGDFARAAALAGAVRASSPEGPLPIEAIVLLGELAITDGNDPGAAARLLRSEARVLQSSEPAAAARLLALAVKLGAQCGDAAWRRDAADAAALGGGMEADDPLVLGAYGDLLLDQGEGERGVAVVRRTAELWLEGGAATDASRLIAAVEVLLIVGDVVRARVLAERAQDAVRAQGDVGLVPWILSYSGQLDVLLGDWPAGAAALDGAVRLAQDTGQVTEAGFNLTELGVLAALRGDRAGMEAALDGARRSGARHVWIAQGAAFAARHLALAEGDAEGALAAGPPDDLANLPRARLDRVGTDAIEALARAGRGVEAGQAISRAAPRVATPYARARLDRCRGLVADDGDFAAPLQRAIETFAELSTPLDRARTELCLGERLRRAGRRVAAREQLRAALATFDELGARAWAERAHRELTASGERLQRREGARDELTPQELQIARLVSDGRTNREVAAMLFLSPKTIETHLGRAYRKLGITRRSDLGRALPRPRPGAQRP